MPRREVRLIYAGKTRYDKPKRRSIAGELQASVKRDIRAGVNRIDGDYTMQAVNGMLYELLGNPGVSAGKSKLAPVNTSSASSGSSPSAYSSAQMDTSVQSAALSSSGGGATAAGALINLVSTIGTMYYNDMAAKTAYQRQNEFYDNHIGMPAKVQEYQDAGLNPMALAGSGPGATSAPSVQPAAGADMSGLTSILGALLNYKAKMKDIEVREKGIDAMVAERAERTIQLHKINEWFETNQMANLGKIEAETTRALAQASTEEQKSALLYQQAVAEYIRNKYADAYEQSILKLREAEVAYKNSATAENYARVTEINQHVQNMVLEGALIVAKTQNMNQVTKNLGIREDMLKFNKEHLKADKVWQRIGQTISAVQGASGAVANVFSCFTPIPSPAFKSGASQNLNYPNYGSSPEYGEPGFYGE